MSNDRDLDGPAEHVSFSELAEVALGHAPSIFERVVKLTDSEKRNLVAFLYTLRCSRCTRRSSRFSSRLGRELGPVESLAVARLADGRS
jgi:hypothetical protein